jgi:hypothetical protein
MAISLAPRYFTFQASCHNILSQDGASHMNARATLLNGKRVKGNGCRMVVLQTVQDNFEVVLEI